MDNSFLEEIEDEVRKDRLFTIYNQYKKHIIGVLITIIAIIIGYLQWLSHNNAVAEDITKQVIQIFFDYSSNRDIKAKLQKLSEKANTHLSEISNVALAAIDLHSSVQDVSDTGYKKLTKASETSKDIVAKDLAILLLTSYDLDKSNEYDKMIQKIELLTFSNHPFRLIAMELLGVIAIKAKQLERAKACFDSIINNVNATDSMRSRAILLKSYI